MPTANSTTAKPCCAPGCCTESAPAGSSAPATGEKTASGGCCGS